AVGADHLDAVGGAGPSAVRPPRGEARARVPHGEEAAVRAHAVVEDDALAAAVLALAARRVVEAQLVDVEAVAGLRHLGGAVEGLAVEAREHRGVAVAPGVAAPAAELRLDDREVPAGVGVPAADEGAADRAEVPRGQAVAEVGGQAAPDEVV